MHRLNRLFLLIVFLCLVGILASCSRKGSNSSLHIQFLDVGQGDCALVECDGHYMLIDGGPLTAADKVYNTLVDNKVNHLDILVVSHIHDDHVGGLARALTYANTVDLTLCTTDTDKSQSFMDFQRELSINDGKITVPQIGSTYMLGSAAVEVLDYGTSNNDSIVLLITYGRTTYLFTGDMEHNMEERLCNKYSDNFPVSFLKVSHHGSDTSTSIRFLRMLMPEYAVISVGKNNGYGHPSENTLSRLEQADVTYYRTDMDGDINVFSDGRTISVKTSK